MLLVPYCRADVIENILFDNAAISIQLAKKRDKLGAEPVMHGPYRLDTLLKIRCHSRTRAQPPNAICINDRGLVGRGRSQGDVTSRSTHHVVVVLVDDNPDMKRAELSDEKSKR